VPNAVPLLYELDAQLRPVGRLQQLRAC
jgi:hypothetical protein